MSIDALRAMAERWEPTGSRVICDPAPTDTDEDWCVLVNAGDWNAFENAAIMGGFDHAGSRIPEPMNKMPAAIRFHSFRCGIVNLICTTSPDFYKRFMAATAVAKRLNLLAKADRIALFQAVLYGNVWVPAPQPADEDIFA